MSRSRNAILQERFLLAGESEEDWLDRVAGQWANSGSEHERFTKMMTERRAFPNTPALANAGKRTPMGSACFVLPVPDDTEGILDTLRAATFVHKYGGGTGFDFSEIRSRRDIVASTGRAAPGPVEGPLKGYSEWIARWSQAGLRPGANMGMLSVDHRDILDFITAKSGTEAVLRNFNLSVKVSDSFMRNVRLTSRKNNWYDNDVWRQLVGGAWQNGEPGVFFEDTANNFRLHPELLAATNPCGEVPLLPYEACVLGSVNLAAHMIYRHGKWYIDEPRLRETVDTLTIMLDNIIELQHYPIPEIERGQKRYRKIGVGAMGVADALCFVGLRYDTDEAIAAQSEWARIIQDQSYASSAALAGERGLYNGYGSDPDWRYPWRRNLNCQVIAPTGTISRIAGCSFGIEPHFDVDGSGNFMSYVVGGEFKDHNDFYREPSFTPASKVSMDGHIRAQAAWQAHVDQAVSKTVNCPNSTTLDDIHAGLVLAWEHGCKGLTVLREGSREEVVIGATEMDCVGNACSVPQEVQYVSSV